jgi:hypothetical protein
MQEIKQSTQINVKIGPVVNSTGVTPVTNLTITGADEAEILKNDTTGTVAIGSTLTAITNCDGWYYMTLTTTDTNTLGPMTVVIQDDSACLPVYRDFMVVTSDYYDAKYSTTGKIPCNVVQISGDSVAADNLELALENGTAGYVASDQRYVGGTLQTANDNGADINAILTDTNSLNDTKIPQTLNLTASGNIGVDWANVENPTTAVDLSATDIQLCDTVTTNTDMRGTDNAALASVLGALADAAAAGDPTNADTVMQYMKQLVNILIGTTGITTFPSSATPANNVSLAEVIRQVYDEVAGLNGSAMRGTDSAALASVCTEARLAELDAANLPTDVSNVKTDTAAILLDTGTDGVIVATNNDKTGYALSAAGIDSILDEVIEGTLTMRQALRIFLSALAGKSTGGGTVTVNFRDNADGKNRIIATVDADGNRSAVTLDGS